MSKGEIVESGSHKELLEVDDGVYFNLIQRQLQNQSSPTKTKERERETDEDVPGEGSPDAIKNN